MKTVKYKKRFKYGICPVCGHKHFVYHSHYVPYPEVWNTTVCENCGCIVDFEDNCLPTNIWDYINEANVRSKKKVLKEIRTFYYGNKDINKIL